MPSVFEIADRYVERSAQLDPIFATHLGVSGSDDRLTDFSPVGLKEAEKLDREFLAAMVAAEPKSDSERVARSVFIERIEQGLSVFDAGEAFRNLNVVWSPMQSVRSVFDLMPRHTTDQWRMVAKRMAEVPNALEGIKMTLREGQQRGLSAARRQANACAAQARAWSNPADADKRFFGGLVADYLNRGGADRKVADALSKTAQAADASYGEFARFLADEYAAQAPEQDAVGPDRYALAVRTYLGSDIDLVETYEWGWAELHRIQQEIAEVCAELCPDMSFHEAVEDLNTQYGRVLQGENALRDWLQALMVRTIEELNGKHFDIPEPLQQLDVRIAPPGGSDAQYYVGPSEDFSRPGTYWYPANGRNHFPLWSEISTAYHQGVPGHHLQIGYVRYSEHLSRFQRNLTVSGHAEGWALYAERLMDELGYLDRPEYRLDMLVNASFRAARVVVDIGLHLGLEIPAAEAFHGGEQWTPALALEFMMQSSAKDEAFLRSEIDRYLGMPAQAISYKIGERLWLAARADAEARAGENLDLKRFHMNALALGPMGLAQLKHELALL